MSKNNLLVKLNECYKILTSNSITESIIVIEKDLQRRISLERELSDLMDTGKLVIPKGDERDYIKLTYTFSENTTSNFPTRNVYVLLKESYIQNDKAEKEFMNARIPLDVVPEKLEIGTTNKYVADWYINKNLVRTFGFTYDSFVDLVRSSCRYDPFLSMNALIFRDNSTSNILRENGSVHVDICIGSDELERNSLKKGHEKYIWDYIN